MVATTVVARSNPYVGPRSFRTGETLYGRERESAELLDLLIADRIVLLYSPSGAGKSSLLNASILPKIQEQGFRLLPVMRVTMEPPPEAEKTPGFNRYIHSLLHTLEEPVAAAHHFDRASLLTMKFSTYLQQYNQRCQQIDPAFDPNQPIVMVFDQFEEIITLNPTDREVKLDFFIQVGEVLRSRNIWALFSIREDYVASLDPYLRPIPTNLSTRYRLNLLESSQALDAISKPAESRGVSFDADAAQKLVDELRLVRVQQPDGSVNDVPGIYVPSVQLQVVCRRLWSKLDQEKTTISMQDVVSAGDVSSALSDYYAVQVAIVANETGVSERAIREWFDRKLITLQGIRGQVLMAPDASEGLSNKAIWRLEQSYLVRAEKRGGATWFELAHDRLMRPIRENNSAWFDQNLSALQRQADVWNSSGRIEGMLFIDDDLKKAEEWASKNEVIMTQVEKDFLELCRQLSKRVAGERRTNRIIRWLFVAAVIALAVAIYATFRADRAEKIATARGLAAASVSNIDVDPELSILLALEGLDISPQPEVIRALHRVVPASRVRQQFAGHTDKVYSVSYSPDGKEIASASKDGSVRVWDVATGQTVQTFVMVQKANSDDFGASAVAYSPDGTRLAAVDADGDLVVWDTSSWAAVITQHISDQIVWAIAYNPDGNTIATGGSDRIARIWDASSGKLLYQLEGHADIIEALTFNQDGSRLATASDDGSAIIWDAQSGENLQKIVHDPYTIASSTRVMGVAFQPGYNVLATSGTDSYVRLWNLDTNHMVLEINAHVDWVYSITFSRDGQTIITTGADRTIHFFDTIYGRTVLTLYGHTDQVFAAAFSPDEYQREIVSASADHTLRLWDVSWTGGQEIAAYDSGTPIVQVKFSPDGNVLASAQLDTNQDGEPDVTLPGFIVLYDANTGAVLSLLDGHKRGITSIDFSPDGSRILSGSYDKTAIIWDMDSGEPVVTLEGHNRAVTTVAFNTDGAQVATGGSDGLIKIWDAITGKEIQSIGMPDSRVVHIAYSPDGKYIAAIYNDNTNIYIWDVATGKLYLQLEGHEDNVRDIAYSPDGTQLASAGDDVNVIVWDLKPKLAPGDRILYRFTNHLAVINAVTFSHDGKWLTSGGADGLIKVWDLEAGEEAYTLYVESLYNDNRIYSLDYSANDKQIVAAVSDWTLRLFTTDINDLAAIARSRLTRGLTPEECLRYLERDCPSAPDAIYVTPRAVNVEEGVEATLPPIEEQIQLTNTPEPPTLTPTVTLTPHLVLTGVEFVVNKDILCYFGPAPDYSVVTGFAAKTSVPVIGLSQEFGREWLQVAAKDVPCWVNARYGRISGSVEKVPYVPVPPK